MKNLLILTLLFTMACGKKEEDPSCESTKEVFSNWYSDSENRYYDLNGETYLTYIVIDDAGNGCSDAENDLKLIVKNNQLVEFYTCANVLYENANYRISCNELIMTLSNGNVLRLR